jgi:hypothetical protein
MANEVPLQRSELERLWRWERLMVRFYAVAMALILISGGLVFAYNETAWVRRSLLGLVLLLVLAATLLQLRERCPRCRARIKLKSGFMLPDRCLPCGVAFERPPKTRTGP